MARLEVPLFPLNTVLFPGGTLPLRIFEPRYLKMVCNCTKQTSGFVVVAIIEGKEVGEVAKFHGVGTLAHIIDFDRLDNGLLGITCRGEQRLRVETQRSQEDGLLIGEVEAIPADPPQTLQPRHKPMVDLLRNVLTWEEIQPYIRFLAEDWQDAAWVSNRLAELLPLPISAKQILLELRDPTQRLDVLQTLLREQKVS
ncbi:MAG: LON peptidase substrate-binding domain-containing protein [Gammaproteobacteria bacterium]|nr:LON peptidase substrate-binding domain-containing protein [Gammaproteobacteria bacterium]MCP5426607.1 LON peptidase substrate-binding domain-containing protein [Gammaproteobacteria bacterium]MCP5459150.1 LON peptidase substrate-binding domain-containing protein [Gammaproteobacteria bacterium]